MAKIIILFENIFFLHFFLKKCFPPSLQACASPRHCEPAHLPVIASLRFPPSLRACIPPSLRACEAIQSHGTVFWIASCLAMTVHTHPRHCDLAHPPVIASLRSNPESWDGILDCFVPRNDGTRIPVIASLRSNPEAWRNDATCFRNDSPVRSG